MALNTDNLAKRLDALTERFAGLATKLAEAAQELQNAGTLLPAEALFEELVAAREEFNDLRSSILDAARGLALTAPPQAGVASLTALEPVLQAVKSAIATEAQRTTLVEARRRVLAVLDRVMTINHVDDPTFAALLECQAKAREIRASVLDPKGPTAEAAAVIMESTPAFSALLTLIEGREKLDDEKLAALVETVARLFGRTLAVAATRGKLTAGARPPAAPRAAPAPKAPDEPVPHVAPEPVPPVAARTPSPVPPVAARPPSPVPPVAARPPSPVPPIAARPPSPVPPVAPPPAPRVAQPVAADPNLVAADPHTIPLGVRPTAPAPVRQEAAAAPPVTQESAGTGETPELDDSAQWWVSAWARWTSSKGTDYTTAVKQELGKYSYILSVPIRQSADYEEGLLAYGYSVLLEFLEQKSPGIVTKALNSLKTFAPGKAGQAQSAGAHLYGVLLGEGRLAEQYPEFVKSVLVAAVPEPGLWTQVRILESTTETRVFTHPSPRIGDPDHTSQRLTLDRQRFTDHRFPVTLPPLTARFFAVAADLSEPRGIDVKLTEGRADSDDAWLLVIPSAGRTDLASEAVRLAREGTSMAGLGKDYASLWVAVFNAHPQTEKKYQLTLTLRKDVSRPGATQRSARA